MSRFLTILTLPPPGGNPKSALIPDLPPVVVPSFKLGWGLSQARDPGGALLLGFGARQISLNAAFRENQAKSPLQRQKSHLRILGIKKAPASRKV
jgi:hypothetical protein